MTRFSLSALLLVVALNGRIVAGDINGTMTNLDGTALVGVDVDVTATAADGTVLDTDLNVIDGTYSIQIANGDPRIPADDQSITLTFERDGQDTRVVQGLFGNSPNVMTVDVTVPRGRCCAPCCKGRRGLFHRRRCR